MFKNVQYQLENQCSAQRCYVAAELRRRGATLLMDLEPISPSMVNFILGI